MNTAQLIAKFVDTILNPIIAVIFAFGFFVFIWGLTVFLWNMRNGDIKEYGKQHMLWGVIGMFIMVSVYGIIALIEGTFGLNLNASTVPSFPTLIN